MNQWNMYLVREMLSRSLLGTALCFVFLVPTNLTAQTPDGFPRQTKVSAMASR